MGSGYTQSCQRSHTISKFGETNQETNAQQNPQRPQHSFFLLKVGSKVCLSKRGNWF